MHYVFGDIHGRSDLLDAAIQDIWAAVRGEDVKFIFLGDYVDRGPDSKGVVDSVRGLVQRGEAVALKGNHEDQFIQYLNREADGYHWFDHYAWATIPPYVPGWNRDRMINGEFMHEEIREAVGDHKDFLESLPFKYETEHHVFVHAGLRPSRSLELQEEQDCIWIRGLFLDASESGRESWGGKHVVHGHTPTSFDPKVLDPWVRPLDVVQLDWRTNMDTGAAFDDGRLAVGVFDLTKPGGPKEVLYYE